MSCLLLHRVTKRFGNVSAVNRISVEFNSGEVTALIGPNGAGKTTVFNLICGYLKLTEGRIFYGDLELTNKSPLHIAQSGFGRMFQDVRVFQRLSVRDNVLLAFRQQSGENPLWAVIARSVVRDQEKKFSSRADELLKMVGLLDQASEQAGRLSYGEQKLLAIARLMAARSSVLLLDEPTAGVTPGAAEKIVRVLREVAEDGNVVVVIEHDMSIVNQWADRVHFMEAGRIQLSGQPDAILAGSHVRQAYLGSAL